MLSLGLIYFLIHLYLSNILPGIRNQSNFIYIATFIRASVVQNALQLNDKLEQIEQKEKKRIKKTKKQDRTSDNIKKRNKNDGQTKAKEHKN